MSTIRPTDRDLVPVGWVQTSWVGPLRFTHQQTGLHLEAEIDGPSTKPGVGDTSCWALRCRKAVGETETTAALGRTANEQRAKQQLVDWMETYNRLREQYGWNHTVAVETVADELCGEGGGEGERPFGVGGDEQTRRW